jgi:hypothetical protein
MARKALLMARSLTPAGRRVGAQLVERFNLTTGRCDPSIARLAADLALNPRSVRRAVRELEDEGLFRVEERRGRTHRNAYLPDWERLGALAALVEKPDSENRTRRAKPDSRVRQNHERESLPPELRESSVARGASAPRSGPDQPLGEPRQLGLRLFGQIEGGRAKAVPADAVEASIRGKYGGDYAALKATLVAWWALSDLQRAEFDDLASFEAWLRAHGPPRASGTG